MGPRYGQNQKTRTKESARLLNESPIGTLERGLLLLETFDADNPDMSLSELRERTGLPKATIQRLMKTLQARKWVAYEPSTRKYHLGASVLRISYLAASHPNSCGLLILSLYDWLRRRRRQPACACGRT